MSPKWYGPNDPIDDGGVLEYLSDQDRLLADRNDLLRDCLAYLKDHEEAEVLGDPPAWEPNKAMRLAGRIREALGE